MKSTFKTPTGGEIVIEPSPTRSGVWVQHKQPGGSTHIVLIPLHLAAIVAQAIEATGTVMEEACLQPELPTTVLTPQVHTFIGADEARYTFT